MLGQQTYEWKLEQGSKEEGPFELEETDEMEGRRAYYKTEEESNDMVCHL